MLSVGLMLALAAWQPLHDQFARAHAACVQRTGLLMSDRRRSMLEVKPEELLDMQQSMEVQIPGRKERMQVKISSAKERDEASTWAARRAVASASAAAAARAAVDAAREAKAVQAKERSATGLARPASLEPFTCVATVVKARDDAIIRAKRAQVSAAEAAANASQVQSWAEEEAAAAATARAEAAAVAKAAIQARAETEIDLRAAKVEAAMLKKAREAEAARAEVAERDAAESTKKLIETEGLLEMTQASHVIIPWPITSS